MQDTGGRYEIDVSLIIIQKRKNQLPIMKAIQQLLFITMLVLPCHASQFMSKWISANNRNTDTIGIPFVSKSNKVLQQQGHHVAGPATTVGDVTRTHEESKRACNFALSGVNVVAEAVSPLVETLSRQPIVKRVVAVVYTGKVARLVGRQLLLVLVDKVILGNIL